MKPDYKDIYNEVVRRFKETSWYGSGPFDETLYTLRVYKMAREIGGRLEDLNLSLLLVASLLHDIGKTDLDVDKMFLGDKRLEGAREEGDRDS